MKQFNYILLIFAVLFSLSSLSLTSEVFAHSDVGDTGGHGSAMTKMDEMMNGMMADSRNLDCDMLNSDQFMEQGEKLMERMMGGDEEKHERIEQAMEKESQEFHDLIHLMMGRAATGCFTDEEQAHLERRLGVAGVAGGVATDRSSQLPAAFTGLVIGLIIGIVAVKFFFTPRTLKV